MGEELDIDRTIIRQVMRLKKANIKPVCILVSYDVLYKIKAKYFNLAGGSVYFPYYSQFGTDTKDKFRGIPIGVVEAQDEVKNYIQVGGNI